MNLRYDLHFAIRVKAHMQPPLGAITGEALVPSFRAARREMLELHVALQRVLVNFGYDIDLDSLRGKLRTAPDHEAPVPPPGMALPPVGLLAVGDSLGEGRSLSAETTKNDTTGNPPVA